METIISVLTLVFTFAGMLLTVTTIRQNSQMIESSTRPVISIYTERTHVGPGSATYYLVVKNFGNSPAYITSINYDINFKDCYRIQDGEDYLKSLSNTVLAPGQSKICALEYDKIDRIVTFTIEYHSTTKKNYKDEIKFNLKSGTGMPYGNVNSEIDEVRIIADSLQDIIRRSF